jgi:hypothetical protein
MGQFSLTSEKNQRSSNFFLCYNKTSQVGAISMMPGFEVENDVPNAIIM